ncbi:hypothetical protein DFQ27_008928 [Actinomortierella ambigua]|uniref:F-box domain-containing protein n=1 Tax=Actinomortierella ambigua TaxID=1343610 RepID=A0A9P6QF63_9FUNG|nr:hypothetical protein DFQ27_008928 [Actinomortierella ambigua]
MIKQPSTRQSALARISTLEHIARHLAAQEDLHAASLVNRSFRRAFTPYLWRSPIFHSERAFVSFVTAIRNGSQASKHVRGLRLIVRDGPSRRNFHPFVQSTHECHRLASTSAFADAANLMIVAKFCSGLRRLTCYGWHLRTHHLETVILELSHLEHFVLIGADTQATNLVSTVADIPSMLPELKTFHLDGQFGLSSQFVHSLGRHGKRIESLKLSSSSLGMLGKGLISLTSLELFNCQNFTDDDVSNLIQYCTKITSISLADCSALTTLSLKRILESRLHLQCLDFRIAARAPVAHKHISIAIPDTLHLRELFLHNIGLTGQHFTDILHASKGLKRIGLSRCFQLAERTFVGALQSLRGLRTLHLVECPLIGESALKQIADQQSETLSSLVIDTCGPMHIRSVVYIVKRCARLECLGVHGYQHITNSPFHHFSTESQHERPFIVSGTTCSTTFELENLDKVIEYSESPWPLEDKVAAKSRDESDNDNSDSSFSSSATEDSDGGLVSISRPNPPRAEAEAVGGSSAFRFEYDSVASAYDLAKQVAGADIGTPVMLEGWATDAAEDIGLTEEETFHTATFKQDPFSAPSGSSFSVSSKAGRRHIDPKGYSRASPRRPFAVRRPATSTPPPAQASSSLANQWQVYSVELQSSNGRHGVQKANSTAQHADAAVWMQGLSQDSTNGTQSPIGQKTDLRGGWGERPRHPQGYTEESNYPWAEQQPTQSHTTVRAEENGLWTHGDTDVEVTTKSTSEWVDYTAWAQTTRGESIGKGASNEHPAEHPFSSQPTHTPNESTKDVALTSPSSVVTENHEPEPSEPVLIDVSDTPSSQDAVTGMGRAMEDMHALGALYSHQLSPEERGKSSFEKAASGKAAEGMLVDLSTGDDEDFTSTSGLRHAHTPNESTVVHVSSSLQGLIDLDLLVASVGFVQPVQTTSPLPLTDLISTIIPKPSATQFSDSIASPATSSAPTTPRPSTPSLLEPCLPRERDNFGFGLEDTMSWLQVLSKRQTSG